MTFRLPHLHFHDMSRILIQTALSVSTVPPGVQTSEQMRPFLRPALHRRSAPDATISRMARTASCSSHSGGRLAAWARAARARCFFEGILRARALMEVWV